MESFDDLIRRKIAEQQIPEFEEKYWLEAEKMLHQNDRKKLSVGWLFVDLAGLCLLIFLWCFATNLGFFKQKHAENEQSQQIVPENINVQQPQLLDKKVGFESIIDSQSAASFQRNQPKFFEKFQQNLSNHEPTSIEFSIENQSFLTVKKSDAFDELAKKGLFYAPKQKNNLISTNEIMSPEKLSMKDKLIEKIRNSSSNREAKFLIRQGSEVANIDTQSVDNQLIEIVSATILKTFFTLESIETRRFFVKKSEPKLTEKLLEIKPISNSIAENTDKKFRTKYGFEGSFEFAQNKIQNGQNLKAFSLGFFTERGIKKRVSIQFGADYQWITHLDAINAANSNATLASQYKFGLSSINANYRSQKLHALRSNFAIKFKIIDAQWLEIGVSERFIGAGKVSGTENLTSPFNALSVKSNAGLSFKYVGLPRFSTESRVAWSSGFGSKIQLSFGWNYQISDIVRTNSGFAKYYSPHWLDLRVRYIL